MLFNSCFAQPGTWVAVYGGDQYDRGRGIAETFDKGFIVCGPTSSYGMGNADFYLLKIDSAGKYQWQNTFGGINIEDAYCVRQTSDSGFILCGFTNSFGKGGYDAYIVKTNSAGTLQWEKTYGGSDWDFAYWIEQTNDGGYILCGETYSFGNNAQAYIIRTNSNGDTLWTKTFGSTSEEAFKEVHQTSDSGFVLGGFKTDSTGDKDFYLMKTDTDGNKKWDKTFGSTQEDACNSIALCTDGGFLLGGYSIMNTKKKNHLVKTDAMGIASTDSIIDLPYSENRSITRVRETLDGNYIMIENTDAGGLGGDEIRIDKKNSGFWFTAVGTLGGTDDDEGYDITLTADSGFALVGFTASYGIGPDNIFIAKINKNANYNNTVNAYTSTAEITEQETNILVYPNPSDGKFKIESMNSQNSVKIYNYVGKIIFETRGLSPFQIDISSQPSGIYLIEFISKEKIIRKKIIILK